MESVTGQVKDTKREKGAFPFLRFLKRQALSAKGTDAQRELYSALLSAKSETDAFRENLNVVTDEDAKEYCIYRLKAAELNLNRHIRLAKRTHLTHTPFEEESL